MSRKSIFGKLIITNLIIILTGMLVTGGIFISMLMHYTTNQKKQALIADAQRLNNITEYQFSHDVTGLSQTLYNMNIESMSNRLDGAIYILDIKGDIVISSSNLSKHTKRSYIGNEYEKRILVNKNNSFLGNMDGFLKNTYLTVSVPLSFKGTHVGATCISVPMPEVTGIIYDIFWIFIPSVLGSALIAAILSYFISKKISKPINAMSDAAKKVSMGDFSVRLNDTGTDEVAQLCRTFNNMTESLMMLDKTRSDFIANVSHELRTPMTTISGFIEGILDGTVPEKKRQQYLIIVSDEIKRLARLVSELLMIARFENDEVKLHITEFDINELIRITFLRFESRLLEKNIKADIKFENDKLFVKADKDGISRVLINLFDNAVKFNERDGYIKVSSYEKSGEAIISIENSGMGIPYNEQAHIWDRLYKTDRSRSHDKKGLGLGLYLVHSILKQHGCQINVQSEPGEYTRFTFTLKKN